jgi:hypothetical protein
MCVCVCVCVCVSIEIAYTSTYIPVTQLPGHHAGRLAHEGARKTQTLAAGGVVWRGVERGKHSGVGGGGDMHACCGHTPMPLCRRNGVCVRVCGRAGAGAEDGRSRACTRSVQCRRRNRCAVLTSPGRSKVVSLASLSPAAGPSATRLFRPTPGKAACEKLGALHTGARALQQQRPGQGARHMRGGTHSGRACHTSGRVEAG